MDFRNATATDVDAIVALVQAAYRGESSRAGWTTEADFLDGQRTDPDEVRDLIAAPGHRVLLCEREGVPVATAYLERCDAVANFGMFAVRPALQGGGLGTAMLDEAERVAHTEWGSTELHLRVITLRVELIAWYQRRGYRRTGLLQAFPYGNPRYGLPRRDDLCFEVLCKSLR